MVRASQLNDSTGHNYPFFKNKLVPVKVRCWLTTVNWLLIKVMFEYGLEIKS